MKRILLTLVVASVLAGCSKDSPPQLAPEQPPPPPSAPTPHASVVWDKNLHFTDEYAWGSHSPGADGYYKLTGWCKNVGAITAYRPKVYIDQTEGWVYSDSAGSGTLVPVDSLAPVDSLTPYTPIAQFSIVYKRYGYISPSAGYCTSCQSTSDLTFAWEE